MFASTLIQKILFLTSPLFLKGGDDARLSILIYHRVLEKKDPLRPSEPDRNEFEQQIKHLVKYCNVLPLDEAINLLDKGKLPPRSICITFDDGYRDNAEIAYPILFKHGATATFFIATGYLNNGLMFNDAIIESIRYHKEKKLTIDKININNLPINNDEEKFTAICTILPKVKVLGQNDRNHIVSNMAKSISQPLPKNLMMKSAQILEIRKGGMSIGAHTVSHPILCSISDDEAFNEITQSKDQLEALLDEKVTLFAYPNGRYGVDYSSAHSHLVEKAGFKAAVATNWGVTAYNTNRYQLPRFTPWDKDLTKFSARLIFNGRNVHLSN